MIRSEVWAAEACFPHHFTGKERDEESGLDYFGARFYEGTLGRFMSPDWSAKAEPVPYSKLDDPQTLNLYAYVRNNPLTSVDPDGHRQPNLTDRFGCSEDEYCLGSAELFNSLQQSTAPNNTAPPPQPRSQPKPGRQPDGSYIAPTGPGSEIDKITDPAAPLPPLIGNGQCVTACKHFPGITAPTTDWTEGPAVSNNDSIPIGTAIRDLRQ